MSTGSWRSAVWALSVLVAASACASGTGSADLHEVAVAPASRVPLCGSGDGAAFEHPDWPVAGGGEAAFLPVVQSSLISVGPNRFLYNVLDEGYRQLAAPDVPSHVDFYALQRDPETPAASVEASYLASGLGRGLYRASRRLRLRR